ncbi:1-phosphatidylinositol-4-phosphate 5-kinase [Bertholletia excelsa]
MHQKRSELRIGKESSGVSSDFNSPAPCSLLPIYQKHLKVQIPSDSYLQSTQSAQNHQNLKQSQFQNDNPSKSKTLLHTTSLRRPLMLNSVNSEPFICFPLLSCLALAAKTIALRLSRYLCQVRWVGVHLRFIILLSLPSLYFFTSSKSNTFFLNFLSILAFSATLGIISLNLTLPHFPSIRSFFTRLSATKLSSTSLPSKPRSTVVWSIGSKPKSEKRPNSGSWVQVYNNGDVYEGEFHRGKCSGSGVYYYSMSGRYEGDWIDGKYDGYGVETWAKGSRYRGQYRQGLRHGIGVYRFYTGDVYAGEWCNGQCHGCGVYTCEDGSRYVGEFKWGVKHGLGYYHFRNGDKYAGEYFSDKMHGFGTYHFGNGHCYEGSWHEGKREGLGMYTFRNGDTQSGHWHNGVLNVSSTQGTIPGSPLAIDHSKVLNAVQEARRVAEKAINLATIEERVNKSVAAANRAANAARVTAVKAMQNQMHHNDNNDNMQIQIA